MIVRLTSWVLRHRLIVVLSWLLLTVGGAAAASSLSGALSKKFSIPGAAVRTNERIARSFGTGGSPLLSLNGQSYRLRGKDLDARPARTADVA